MFYVLSLCRSLFYILEASLLGYMYYKYLLNCDFPFHFLNSVLK